MNHQLWLVAKKTYMKRLKSFSFWALVLVPLLIPILSLTIGYLAGSSGSAKLAIVNQPALAQALKSDKLIDAEITSADSSSAAQIQLNNKKIDGFLTFDSSSEKFHLTTTSKTTGKIDSAGLKSALTQI